MYTKGVKRKTWRYTYEIVPVLAGVTSSTALLSSLFFCPVYAGVFRLSYLIRETIGQTSVQYVRCIKPNAAKLPGRMENAKVLVCILCSSGEINICDTSVELLLCFCSCP